MWFPHGFDLLELVLIQDVSYRSNTVIGRGWLDEELGFTSKHATFLDVSPCLEAALLADCLKDVAINPESDKICGS